MSAPVFLASPDVLAGASVGGVISLSGDEARHALKVVRLRSGEAVDLVDGRGRRVNGVALASSDSLDVRVEAVRDEPVPAVRLVLVQALAKSGRDEMAVETATEVGMDAVVPWQAARSVVQWRGDRVTKGVARWRAVVAAATKQSRRAWLASVESPVSSSDLADRIRGVVAGGGVAWILDADGSVPVAGAALPESGEVLIVVGPEGGMAPAEIDQFVAAGGEVVRLGPTVVRASTAGPVAVALAASRLGRWL